MTENKVFKTWTFRHSNPDDTTIDFFTHLTANKVTVGLEHANQEGKTPHLQGAIVFRRGYRLTQLKKLSPSTHWEPGLTIDPENYCLKENIIRHEGYDKLNWAEYIWNGIKEGKTDLELVESNPKTLFMLKAVGNARNLLVLPRKDPPEVYWLWGPTGVGKTKWVEDTYPDYQPLTLSGDKHAPFVNGYTGFANCVLFDDFRSEDASMAWLLRITDRYRCVVNMKGYSLPWNPKVIVFTSPIPPDSMYGDEDVTQLLRRITEVKNFVTVTGGGIGNTDYTPP